VEALLTYIQSTGRRWEEARDRATPLFLSAQGRHSQTNRSEHAQARHLSTSHVRRIVDRVERLWRQSSQHEREEGVVAGEGRAISPHALRHSTAIALLEGNEAQGRPPASVEHVRGWLGHFDIRTTQGYLAHLDARRHRRPFTLTPTAARSVDPVPPGEREREQDPTADTDD
jgi:integrase